MNPGHLQEDIAEAKDFVDAQAVLSPHEKAFLSVKQRLGSVMRASQQADSKWLSANLSLL